MIDVGAKNKSWKSYAMKIVPRCLGGKQATGKAYLEAWPCPKMLGEGRQAIEDVRGRWGGGGGFYLEH